MLIMSWPGENSSEIRVRDRLRRRHKDHATGATTTWSHYQRSTFNITLPEQAAVLGFLLTWPKRGQAIALYINAAHSFRFSKYPQRISLDRFPYQIPRCDPSVALFIARCMPRTHPLNRRWVDLETR